MSVEEPNTKRYETQIYRTNHVLIDEIMNRYWAAEQATWKSARDLERNFPWATREEPEESRDALQDRRPANFPQQQPKPASPESSDTALKHLTDTLLDTTLDDQTRSDAADELAYEHNTMVSIEPKHRIGGSRLKPEARAATATSRRDLELAMFGAPQSQGRYERRRAQLPSWNS